MAVRAGFGKVDVSPPPNPEGRLDVPILGFWYERAKAYREIHDPLHARAVVFECGDEAAVLVSVDMIGDGIGFGAQARERIMDQFGLPASRVMIACTHPHTTPETIGLCGAPIAPAYREQLVAGIVQAVGTAMEGLQAARLRAGAVMVEGVTVNRRAQWFERADPAALASLTPEQKARCLDFDKEVRVLLAEDEHGRPLGAVVNFAGHPVAVQTQPFISADYVGCAMAKLERALAGAICLFTNAAAGDVNPARKDGFKDIEWTADRLVESALNAARRADELAVEEPSGIAGSCRALALRRRTIEGREELTRERERLDREIASTPAYDPQNPSPGHAGARRFQVNERLAVAALPELVQAEIHVMRVGPLLFAGVPGELLSCLGRDIRRALVDSPVCVVSYANGYIGYICPKEAFLVGGYETRPARWSRLAPGEGERIRDAVIDVACQLIRG